MKRFIVSPSPFIKTKTNSTYFIEQKSLILIFLLAVSVIILGGYPLLIAGISILSALVFELLYNVIAQDSFSVENGSFLVVGLVFALLCGANTPFYIPIIGVGFGIIFIKMMFGGYSNNVFNIPAVGFLFVALLFKSTYAEWGNLNTVGFARNSYEMISSGKDIVIDWFDMFKGQTNTGFGALSFVLVLIVGFYLITARVIDFKMPIIAVIVCGLMGVILSGFNIMMLPAYVLAGNFLFVSFIMLTDFATSPNTSWGQIVYAIIFGLLCSVVIRFNIWGDVGIIVALIISNAFTPLIDRVIRQRYFGEGRR